MLFFGEISDMDDKTLFSYALAARAQAYTPYSHFKVGAALLCADGTVYTGCNIENAAFSPTVCAERVAFLKPSLTDAATLRRLPWQAHLRIRRRTPPARHAGYAAR